MKDKIVIILFVITTLLIVAIGFIMKEDTKNVRSRENHMFSLSDDFETQIEKMQDEVTKEIQKREKEMNEIRKDIEKEIGKNKEYGDYQSVKTKVRTEKVKDGEVKIFISYEKNDQKGEIVFNATRNINNGWNIESSEKKILDIEDEDIQKVIEKILYKIENTKASEINFEYNSKNETLINNKTKE